MKPLQYIYKTKTLAKNGKFLLFALAIITIAGPLIIPTFKVTEINGQLYTINGNHFKYDDKAEIEHLLISVKKNDGYLCLGTSESTDIKYGNYYNFLNKDSTIPNSFSILSGAGRTCGMYSPIFLRNKELVKNLKIIYFINPTYWGVNLCTIDKAYLTRYLSYGTYADIGGENKSYIDNIQLYKNRLKPSEKISQQIEYYIRAYRKRFFVDLKYWLNIDAYNKEQVLISEKSHLPSFPKFGEIDTEKIDTVWNVNYAFAHKEWFKPINENENYRYEELASFINLCKDLEIECHFIIGPYNERFIRNYQPSSLPGFKNVTNNLRQLLINENVDFIDASDISEKPGTFIDHQHHSSYGAYLIYQKIRTHFYEKESN